MAPIVRHLAQASTYRSVSESERNYHGAISLRSISPHPSLLRNDTFPRRGGRKALRRRRQPQDDVLVVIAEAATEDVDPAGMAGVGLDLDLEPDRMMAGKIEVA